MKQIFCFISLAIFSTYVIAQENSDELSFGINYPYPVGNNFLSKHPINPYQGIGGSLAYSMAVSSRMDIGVYFSSTYMVNDMDVVKASLLVLHPGVFTEYEFAWSRISLKPRLGIGYSNWQFTVPEISFQDAVGVYHTLPREVTTFQGCTMEGGLKCVLNTDTRVRFFIETTYAYTRLGVPEEPIINSSFNRDLQVIEPGVGMIWNFRQKEL